MDNLKEEIKVLLRQRCDELGVDYFDDEEIIVDQLTKQKTAELAKKKAELDQLKKEIELRKSLNNPTPQTSTTATTLSNWAY